MTKSHKKHSNNSSKHEHELKGDSHTSGKHHSSSHRVGKKKTLMKNSWMIISIVLAVLLVASIFTNGFSLGKDSLSAEKLSSALVDAGLLTSDQESQAVAVLKTVLDAPSKEKVSKVDKPLKVDLYVMSQCPYGVQAENTMFKAIKELGEDNFDLNVDFIASPSGNGFSSLHGQNEVDGDKVQLCMNDLDSSKFLDFVLCMNENPKSIPGNWETCADKLGVDKAALKSCFEGEKANQLLTESLTNSATAGASGSPTIYIGDSQYAGGRSMNDFKRAFCNAFPSEKPSACDSIPAPKEFEVLVLNDERCSDCQAAQKALVGQLKSLFPGMKVKTVDYSSDEGKTLMKDTNTKFLPAFLFSEDVKGEDNYARIKPYLVPAGNYDSLMIGASFDPTKEICDNGKDDTGNGKIDCEDADCKDVMVCRTEKPKNLQVFVMSDCPYGKKAIEALKPVRENFGDDLDLEVHYIATPLGDGSFNSLHGTYEAEEDMAQLCVKEHSPDQWFDYIYCRSLEGIRGNDWHTCAEQSGVDVNAVETCLSSDEGANLLTEDVKIANALGIGASPTWLANNKYQFSGIDAETVKTNFCKYNDGLAGCENTLTSDTGSVPAGACG